MENNFLITKIHNIILVGKDAYPDKKVVFTNNLSHNELIFHFSGNTTIFFNDTILKTEPNSIRFLPKCEIKKYIVYKEIPGECIDVFFDTDIPISNEAFVINTKTNININKLFKKMFSVWVSKNSGYYFECISIINRIFAEIQKNNYIPEKQYTQIKPALDYIENSFLNQKVSIDHLSNICGISKSYLKRLFIKKFGIPPVKYIIQLKINYACDLLRSGLYNVSQVSIMCGYSDIYYFSHQFKEYMGVSPTEFINKYRSSI